MSPSVCGLKTPITTTIGQSWVVIREPSKRVTSFRDSIRVGKQLHHVSSPVVLIGYDVKQAVSLLFVTVKPDLSEAHVFPQLIKAISEQKLAVDVIVMKDPVSVRIGLDGCILWRTWIFHQKTTDECPSTWIKEKHSVRVKHQKLTNSFQTEI